jgi:hypothetical protein
VDAQVLALHADKVLVGVRAMAHHLASAETELAELRHEPATLFRSKPAPTRPEQVKQMEVMAVRGLAGINAEDLGDFLAAHAPSASLAISTMSSLQELGRLMAELREQLPEAESGLGRMARQLSKEIDTAVCDWRMCQNFVGEQGTFSADCHLKQLLAVQEFTRSPELNLIPLSLGLDSNSSPLMALRPENAARYQAEVVRLCHQVRLALESGPTTERALLRLKLWLEKFGSARLLSDIDEAGPNKTEMIVQAAIDEHLFREGFFPISHCAVGTGVTDTFVHRARGLLADAAKSGEVPLLLEIKQVIRSTTVSGQQILTAIGEAQRQLSYYAQALQSSPEWSLVSSWAVVVYGGSVMYAAPVTEHNATLVHVGTGRPSRQELLPVARH